MYRILTSCLLFSLLFCANCSKKNYIAEDSNSPDQKESLLKQKAIKLAHQYLITDGHVDLPYRLKVANFRLEREYLGIPIETDRGDFDYVRAKKGGLDVPFMSIYLPSTYQETGGAKALADTLINMIEGIAAAHPDKFAIAYSSDQAMELFKKGIIALPMGMENGAGIEDDISNVAYFKKRGISYITLTHSKDNLICDSSYDSTATWQGLSPFGREVVKEMNKVGIMVDVSHISDNTFYQVMKLTRAPVIASHSSCRKFTPGFERNMDDDMIRMMGKKGGVIQINFGSSFLDGALQKQNSKNRIKLREILEKEGIEERSEEAQPIVEQFQKENPSLYADVKTVANHIDHVVKLAGIDHVAFGSDFDGVGDSLPTGLKDVSQYPNLIYELLSRGYSEEDIEKVCYKNVFRVWSEVERVAQESQTN